MKSIFQLLGAVLLLAWATGCFRQDIRTLEVKVPQMKSPECSKVIQDALSRIEGIRSAQPDVAQRVIVVTYDSKKLAIRNIEFLIAGVGFDANEEPGKPDAKVKLPEGCR